MYYEQYVCLKECEATAISANIDGKICYKPKVVTAHWSEVYDIAFVHRDDAVGYARAERDEMCGYYGDHWTEPKPSNGMMVYPRSDADW